MPGGISDHRAAEATGAGDRVRRSFLTRTAFGRAALRVGAVILLVLLVGATYQGVSNALERRQYPRLGGLIDIGGFQLHLYCMGSGAPTVLLEAPAGGASVAWARVQPAIARVTRACSYDRAGLGWSERGDAAYDPMDVPVQLDTLMRQAGVSGPFVLVGQGLGAAFATLFAARFARESAGLVLINAPAGRGGVSTHAAISAWSPWLARFGILRISGALSKRTRGLPQPAGGALAAFLNRPDHLTNAALELLRSDDIVQAAATATLPEDLPVVRVSVPDAAARVAFLVTDAQAAPVSAAVDAMVRQIRARSRR
jgi:pimeloyl-ACP methyl ester carboxylesterase